MGQTRDLLNQGADQKVCGGCSGWGESELHPLGQVEGGGPAGSLF